MTENLQSGVRFAAWPTKGQGQIFARWIGSQRFVYNAKVDEDQLFAAQRRMVLRDDPSAQIRTPLDNSYAQFKDDELTPWLDEVPSVVLRQGVCRWRAAKQRQLAKLAQAPRRRNRLNFDSVRLDSDAFYFEQVTEPDGSSRRALFIGTKTCPLGELKFTAHRPFGEPKMLTIRRQSTGRWFVSFSYEHEAPEGFVQRTPAELAYEFDLLGDDALAATTLGLDRNVSDNAIAASDGRFFMPERVVLERLKRKEIGAKRQQRRLARQQKGSANRAKTKRRLARKHAYKADALRDFSHQTSHAIASGDTQVVAVEALQIQNMTKRPKARFDEATGRWLKNGARAKAGLNKAILSRAWGRIAEQLAYKLSRQNKLLVPVAPQYSSQECSRCGHTHPDNRVDQRFVCQRCGYEAHADLNAAQNVKQRAIALIRSGELQQAAKPKKRVALRRRTKTGPDRPDVPAEST